MYLSPLERMKKVHIWIGTFSGSEKGENNITPYKFNLLNNSHTTCAVLNKYYHLNWSVETGRSASLDNTVYMLMTEDATGYEVAFAITPTAEIPDNILK